MPVGHLDMGHCLHAKALTHFAQSPTIHLESAHDDEDICAIDGSCMLQSDLQLNCPGQYDLAIMFLGVLYNTLSNAQRGAPKHPSEGCCLTS